MPDTPIPPPFDAYVGDEPYIFVSYSHKDAASVFPELYWLRERGYRIWYDDGIDPGSEWPAAIEQALDNAAYFVVFISPHAIDSKNVRDEVNHAINQEKPFLAIHLVETELRHGLKLRIGHIQAILKHEIPAGKYESRILKSLPDALKKVSALLPDVAEPHLPIAAHSHVTTDPGKIQAPTIRINPIDSAEMIWIPPGDFTMGNDEKHNPRRTVTLSGFWVYKNVVTVGMYKEYCQETGATMPDAQRKFNPNWVNQDHPIVNVSWDDAQAYCMWAGVQLPTEAQWEKAARGIDGRQYTWGSDWDATKLWCSIGQKRSGTTAVGVYGNSPYGCTDMAGNVWQWSADWYDAEYWNTAPTKDPTGPPTGELRVQRGGAWYNDSYSLFCTACRGNNQGEGYSGGGFRCVSANIPSTRQEKLAEPASRPGFVVFETVVSPKPLQPTVRINPIDGAEMVWIPPGDFLMGDDDRPDSPRRSVTLSGYWIYKNAVTVGLYKGFCRETQTNMPPERGAYNGIDTDVAGFNPGWTKEDHPIVNVTWDEAQAYCRWARASLPTEAQWEKAARGTDGRVFPWGDTFDMSKVWASKKEHGDARGTSAVGKYGVSPYNCTDMAGNVSQWCSDWYDENYCFNAPVVDPAGPPIGTNRAVRGGSWDYIESILFRTAYRYWVSPSLRLFLIGFRCVVHE